MTIPGQPTDGINLAVLNEALVPYATISAVNTALNTKLNTSGGVVSGLLSFSGIDSVGIRLKSLTSVQYGNLTPGNGDLFVDSNANRVDVRLNGVTQELLDTGGGQRINGTLGISGFLTDAAGSNRLRFDNNGSGATRVISDGSIFLERFANNGVVNLGTSANHNLVLIRNSATQVTLASGSTDVTGNLTATGTGTFTGALNANGGIVLPNNASILGAGVASFTIGDANDTVVFASGSTVFSTPITIGSGGPLFRNSSGTIEARNNANSAFAPISCGNITVPTGSLLTSGAAGAGVFTINNDGNSRWQFNAAEFIVSGNTRPSANNSRNLGDSSFRFANVFAQTGDFSGNLTASGTVTSPENIFTNGANSTRVARATGTTGRLQIYRPNDPATVSVEFGGGNDEIRIRGGLGSFNHTGAQLQISSSGTMALGCTGALTLVSNGTTAQTITGADTVFGGSLSWSDVRIPRVAKTFQTQCFESTLSAWQETSRQEASPTGPRWSVMGATPIVRQTHAAVATDLATAITRLNTLCTHLTNFGLFN